MENEQPVRRMTNSIRRRCISASLPVYGEAQTIRTQLSKRASRARASERMSGLRPEPEALKLCVKAAFGMHSVVGDGMVVKVVRVNRGDACAHRRSLPGVLGVGRCRRVRASIVASNPGNSGGAKGRRKVNA
jgi:hypothetical protein